MTARIGWPIGLVVAAGALRLAGRGLLAPPPLTSTGGLEAWFASRGPAAAVMALLRAVTELGVWYLLAVTALQAVAVVTGRLRVLRLVELVSSPTTMRFVSAGLGMSLAAGSASGTATAAAAPAPPTSPVEATASPEGLDSRSTSGTARMVPGSPPSDERGGTATMAPVAPPAPPDERVEAPATWTVSPGESLWTIAADVLEARWGRPAADAEVVPFWRALIEVNRSRLIDPQDPGLIHPGQRFSVPATDPA